MSMLIIELLEMINVDNEQTRTFAASPVQRNEQLHIPVKLPPIVNAGERILVDQTGKIGPLFRIQFHQNFFQGCDHRAWSPLH
jgi:hypothetical protein